MRLELGPGDHPNIEGEDVVYADLRDFGLTPFYYCDVFGTLPFHDGAFEHVRAHHVIEHCSHMATDATLKEWVRVLAPGGTMHLELPDLQAQAALILYDHTNRDAVRMMFGNQDYANDTNVHRTGFTAELLGQALERAGLTNVHILRSGGCLTADGEKPLGERAC